MNFIGHVIQFSGFILAAKLGFAGGPFFDSVAVCSLIMTMAYLIIRAPQMFVRWQEGVGKFFVGIFFLFLLNGVLSSLVFGIGSLLGRIF